MAEIFAKNDDGKITKVGDVNADQFSRIKNSAGIDSIKNELDKFWTNEKLGKHNDLKAKHGAILMKDLKVPAEDFFEQVKENNFKFQTFGPIAMSSFLKRAKIDKYVQPQYLDDCLKVTTPRPAIGRGEFLFVASFNNIMFSKGKGDLVDTDGNRIEVKGKHANFGSDGPYKQMSQSLMYSIYSVFNTNTSENGLTLETMAELEKLLLNNPSRRNKVFSLLQNIKSPSASLTSQMAELFDSIRKLPPVIAAAHFYAYMKIQKANYLLALNDNVFWGFKAPNTLAQAAETMQHFNINGWMTGNKGISFTVKNG